MVTVDLPQIFVNLVPTGERVQANSEPGRDRQTEVEGTVEVYAGGRTRTVIQEGARTTFTFVMLLVPLADLLTLESWIGRTVLVRERFGQKHYGSYFRVGSREVRGRPGRYNCSIELSTTTFVEGV